MARVDPDDDTIDRWIVRRYTYDPDRRERRHVVLGAFDNEEEFEQLIHQAANELKAQRRQGLAETTEHITGVHQEPGYAARQAERRAAWEAARRRSFH